VDLKIGVGGFMERAHSNVYRCQAVLDVVERERWTEPARSDDGAL
jgi:hypothetical protein